MNTIDIRTAPIRAADLDKAGAIIRAIVGAGMVCYSIVAAARLIGAVLSPVLGSVDLGPLQLPWGVLIGVTIGLLVTAGQWASVTRAPLVHWLLILTLDAPLSAYQTFEWLHAIAEAHNRASGSVLFGIIAASAIYGVCNAKFGEKLLVSRKEVQE